MLYNEIMQYWHNTFTEELGFACMGSHSPWEMSFESDLEAQGLFY